jgi:methylenetetrahydrofolate reductase (NADPH)
VEIASLVKNKYKIEALAHLSCVTSTKAEIDSILEDLESNGINNILALRGDIPDNPDVKFPTPLQYPYAKDLVKHIHDHGKFCIGGACYPEGHIECASLEEDLMHLKEKVDCGIDFLITQLFFDNELYYNFKDKADKLSINVPITVGIMPVINKKQIEKITSLCNAKLPDKFKRIMNKYEYKPEALKEAGIAYATEQIIDLLSWGADGIHIYTMNHSEVAKKIVDNVSEIREALNNK